jgi:hypothetical protein
MEGFLQLLSVVPTVNDALVRTFVIFSEPFIGKTWHMMHILYDPEMSCNVTMAVPTENLK